MKIEGNLDNFHSLIVHKHQDSYLDYINKVMQAIGGMFRIDFANEAFELKIPVQAQELFFQVP